MKMSDISSLIDVYRMEEIKPETRASVIVKLGEAINYTLAANVTEPLVFEFVNLLGGKSIAVDNVQKFLAHYAKITHIEADSSPATVDNAELEKVREAIKAITTEFDEQNSVRWQTMSKADNALAILDKLLGKTIMEGGE
jgi:hypothetical protein